MAKVGHLVKESMVKEVSAVVAESPNLFIISVKKLAAGDSNEFRRSLHQGEASLHVIKRRVGIKVLEGVKGDGLPKLAESRNGSVGLITAGEDAAGVAKRIIEFVKTHEDQVSICGAFVEGSVVGGETVKDLADLPSREALLAQVVFTLEAPINDVCSTVERLIGDICWTLEQASEKAPAGKAAPEQSQENQAPAQEAADQPGETAA